MKGPAMPDQDDDMTDRQREIKARLDQGKGAREIGDELGISRNAVYQQIQRMRKHGNLEPQYTPSGQPPRESRLGEDVLRRLVPSLNGDDEMANRQRVELLLLEVKRTRDELDAIANRLTYMVEG